MPEPSPVLGSCPVCGGKLTSRGDEHSHRTVHLNCTNCGNHRFSREAIDDLPNIAFDPHLRARLAHGVWKLAFEVVVTTNLIERLVSATVLPSAVERIDNLVLYLASDLEPGVATALPPKPLRARLGCETVESASWVINQAVELGLITPSGQAGYALTAAGWQRHSALVRDGAGSRHAFMAMPFGDDTLNRFYRDHLRPTVALAGFDLRTTDEGHKTAGSIDNRMRVEIRTSRFLVCDLNHSNRGAYWEAGFAEGLGRPVFYICKRNVLEDKRHPDHPHFDTAHQLIVGWDPADPSAGMDELKDVIRATLPGEARMEDV